MRHRIAIDTATLYAGRGGSGGGIWTYTKELLLNLDKLAPSYPDLEFIVFANKQFDLDLKAFKIVVVAGDYKRLALRLKYLYYSLPALCKQHKVQLLHRLTPEVPVVISIPVVATLHDFMVEFYERTGRNKNISIGEKLRNGYFSYAKLFALKKCKRIITPSQFIRQEAIDRFGADPEKVKATELGAQTQAIAARPQPKTGNAIYLYNIAAFHAHKGHIETIRVFEKLRRNYGLDIHLCFRGNVFEAAAFETIKNRMDASPEKDRIHLIEFDKNSTLQDIYAKADIVILLSEYEGFGLPIIEAQSFGKTVICSSIGTFKEVAGDSALFVSPSADEAAETIYQFLTNKDMQIAMQEKGSANAEKFTWNKTAKKTIEVYMQSLNLKIKDSNTALAQIPNHSIHQ